MQSSHGLSKRGYLGDSAERSKNYFTTFDMHTEEDEILYEDRENFGISFPEALAKYKDMLEKMKSRLIPAKIRTKTQQRPSLLKKEEADKLRQQFDHVRRTRSEKRETVQWISIEQCHEQLVNLACREAEGDRLKKIMDEINGIIEDMLKQMAAMETRSLISNFINYKCVAEHEQNAAFSDFFKQLYTSSPKLNNFQEPGGHYLFIRFLNDLIAEERLHITKNPRFNVDPRKVLPTVDTVFGGHFITMYACLKCTQPHFVCESFLDISLPMCFHKEHLSYSGGGTGEAYRVSSQRDLGSTVDRRQQHSQTPYSDQGKELMPAFLEALNEERRYHPRPVALTECLRFFTATKHIPEGYLCLSCHDPNQTGAAADAQTMPPAMKRTLIYDPPAILVLHMQCFERTATGLTKRSDRVIYEELLDLGPYCSSDCLRIDPEDKNVWYSLYGVVVNSGSSELGHCIAYVKVEDLNSKLTMTFLQESFLKRDTVAIEQKMKLASGGRRSGRRMEWRPSPLTDGKWICVSDTNTRDVTLHEALNQEAFMLFYRRVSKHEQ